MINMQNSMPNISENELKEAIQKIEEIIKKHPVVLFMKGTPESPMCGFSATVVQILKISKVPFAAVNVLDEYAIREGIKKYSDWPTIPQLYVKQKFIGGCDILKDAYDSNELDEIFKDVVA